MMKLDFVFETRITLYYKTTLIFRINFSLPADQNGTERAKPI